MHPEYTRFKPGVSRRVHLFAAPFLWTAAGLFLMRRGWQWLDVPSHPLALLAAMALGSAKSFFLLDRVIRRTMSRIGSFAGNTCLGAVYSWKSWLLVLSMIAAGTLARHWGAPGSILGICYLAIGWSLFLSSRIGWFAFRQER